MGDKSISAKVNWGGQLIIGKPIVVQRGDEDEGRIKFVISKCNALRLWLQPTGNKNHYGGCSPKFRHDDCSCTARASSLPGRNEAALLMTGSRIFRSLRAEP
jgi:hypothetical protein